MATKNCGTCNFYNREKKVCWFHAEVSDISPIDFCKEHWEPAKKRDKHRKAEQMRKTVFAHITQSTEILAPKLVYRTICVAVNRVTYSCWKSTITDESYRTKDEAIAATVAKLKEVYNG